MKITLKALTALLVLALFIGALSAFATAGTPPPVPTIPPATATPTATPTSQPSGGGGSGGSYNPPHEVYPKIIPVKNSMGAVIGNVTAKSASDISVSIEQPVTVNGQTYTVHIDAKLNSLPSDPKLDIVGETGDSSKLPSYLTLNYILTQVNLTRFSNGWSIQDGSLKLTLTVPKALVENAILSKSTMVRYDGASYELLTVNIQGPDANGNVTFSVVSPNEQFKYDSYTRYVLVTDIVQPTVTPTPTPTPMPESGTSFSTLLIAFILMGVVAAAVVLYYVLTKKQ
ncbi:hypothetical protein MCP_0878 [Methanocella paludicola SANAE]|uniref:Uncharacterized protein n=1 Tax=Methanocella paludicola (strain DSM 17711 / JCM 13418 / NBRC 101707 / SANAE) TaxID=304371 RepID=D1YWX8_METPS|nr:hypothetical protein [Methanocella paludicola]BAI60950.1 hypothetical protein MCP_0878 [Methanocella paludicola SANAE]